MALLVVKQTVPDFDDWYKAYQALDHLAHDYGCTSKRIWRDPHDTNTILLTMEFPTENLAHQYLEDDEIIAATRDGRLTIDARTEYFKPI